MALCSFALQKPIGSHSGPMTDHLGWATHEQDGNGSLYGYFGNAANQASSHFWVAKIGTLEQYIDTAFASWAQEAGNFTYNSIETEGTPDEPWTAPQMATMARLYVWGKQIHGIPLVTCDHGGRGITTHAHYPSGAPDVSWGGHPCPGTIRSAQLPLVVATANILATGGTPVPALPALARPSCAIVMRPQNDGYWQVCQDGGIFAFGDAPAFGSNDPLPADQLQPGHLVTAAAGTASGNGLILNASDGGAFTFGDAVYRGSLSQLVSPSPQPLEA